MTDIEELLRDLDLPVRPPVLPETDVSYTVAETPVGPLVLAATGSGLIACSYEEEERVTERIARLVSPRVLRSERRLDAVRRELDGYFAGTLRGFSLPVDLDLAAPFSREVLRAVRSIPYGTTTTYGDVARAIRRPRAARAVGNALAVNPVCIVVPCHRVVRTDGGGGGYAGGTRAKRMLLDLEGASTRTVSRGPSLRRRPPR